MSVIFLALFAAAAHPGHDDVAYPGYDDIELYRNASSKLVGAMSILSFSSASADGPHGSSISGHSLPAPEALCNCACYPLANFAYCQNTAKTTVGISTFSMDGDKWISVALRYFAADSPGAKAGRTRTNFLERATLPQGPGGPMLFDVAYTSDGTINSHRAELVRGRTGGVSCDAAPLCDKQCAGVGQYEAWKAGCPP